MFSWFRRLIPQAGDFFSMFERHSAATVAAADATIAASTAMDMTTLTSAQQKLQRSCQTCHQAHRERLQDGTYRMK